MKKLFSIIFLTALSILGSFLFILPMGFFSFPEEFTLPEEFTMPEEFTLPEKFAFTKTNHTKEAFKTPEEALSSFSFLFKPENQEEAQRMLHILWLHYRIIEIYMAEKLAAKTDDDTPEFDHTIKNLLDLEENILQQLQPQTMECCRNLEFYLSKNDSGFNFSDFRTYLETRSFLVLVLSNYITQLTKTNKYINNAGKLISMIIEKLPTIKNKEFQNKLKNLNKQLLFINDLKFSPDKYSLFNKNVLFLDETILEKSQTNKLLQDAKFCLSRLDKCIEGILNQTNSIKEWEQCNKILKQMQNQIKALQNTEENAYFTALDNMRGANDLLQSNFVRIYEQAKLFAQIYSALYESLYHSLPRPMLIIPENKHGSEFLPRQIFPLHGNRNINYYRSMLKLLNIFIKFKRTQSSTVINDIKLILSSDEAFSDLHMQIQQIKTNTPKLTGFCNLTHWSGITLKTKIEALNFPSLYLIGALNYYYRFIKEQIVKLEQPCSNEKSPKKNKKQKEKNHGEKRKKRQRRRPQSRNSNSSDSSEEKSCLCTSPTDSTSDSGSYEKSSKEKATCSSKPTTIPPPSPLHTQENCAWRTVSQHMPSLQQVLNKERILSQNDKYTVIYNSWGTHPYEGSTVIVYIDNHHNNGQQNLAYLPRVKDDKFHRMPQCIKADKYLQHGQLITTHKDLKLWNARFNEHQQIHLDKDMFAIAIEAVLTPKYFGFNCSEEEIVELKSGVNQYYATHPNNKGVLHRGAFIFIFDVNKLCFHQCFHEYKESAEINTYQYQSLNTFCATTEFSKLEELPKTKQ